jgi:hypothetical protein
MRAASASWVRVVGCVLNFVVFPAGMAAEPVLTGFGRSAKPSEPPFVAATNSPAFRAVQGPNWPAGLVPVFAVEKPGGWELRRHPSRGQEEFSEPFFFGLPAAGESASASTAGRWEINATRNDGSTLRLAIELAEHHGRLAGRFDQTTDYRFAQITGGTTDGDRLELDIKYINDEFRLLTARAGDRWKGRWTRRDESEGGALELFRQSAPKPIAADPFALFEARPQQGDANVRRYLLAGEPVPAGWARATNALVRVWRVTSPCATSPDLPLILPWSLREKRW